MRSIRLENINKSYKDDVVISGLNLIIPSGKFFALLGPSGCGKTTLLRMIAGFESVTSGQIYLGNQDITNVPINERKVNTVFQQYALFPHLNVFDNVAFGPRIAGLTEDVIEQKVFKVLRAVRLEAHRYKSIHRLSGGQRQRVALARAIVNEPSVLLLDEPLAALDVKLREQMLVELIDLQEQFKTTFVYVTHDQFEALTVADQMAIMNMNGEIEQVGTPKEIYEFPVSSFVAKFVGTTNIVQGTVNNVNDIVSLDVNGMGTVSVPKPRQHDWLQVGTTAYVSLRPEKIWISKGQTQGFSNHITGIVESIVYHGRSTQYNVRVKPGILIQVFEQNEEHFPKEVIDYDDKVNLYWQKENVVLLPR